MKIKPGLTPTLESVDIVFKCKNVSLKMCYVLMPYFTHQHTMQFINFWFENHLNWEWIFNWIVTSRIRIESRETQTFISLVESKTVNTHTFPLTAAFSKTMYDTFSKKIAVHYQKQSINANLSNYQIQLVDCSRKNIKIVSRIHLFA